MEAETLEDATKVLDSALSELRWRLRSSSRRRLQMDILALCSRMRPVVMIDYGGKMPELQEQLCSLLKLCRMGAPAFDDLKVMIVEDMVYLVHVRELAEHVRSFLDSKTGLLFVDLEQDPPKMVTQEESSSKVMHLTSAQRFFSLLFPVGGMNGDLLSSDGADEDKSFVSELNTSSSSEFIDLSCHMKSTQVSLPTLNGWLLGYPIVYLFGKEHIEDAIYNLSTKYLHVFKIIVCRNNTPKIGSQHEEMLSFSVPYDLSMQGTNEPWAQKFLAEMHGKWERCKQIWRSVKMEVCEFHPQAVVL